jgi:hypothetical protein
MSPVRLSPAQECHGASLARLHAVAGLMLPAMSVDLQRHAGKTANPQLFRFGGAVGCGAGLGLPQIVNVAS